MKQTLTPEMKATLKDLLSQRWFATQHELLSYLRAELERATPKLEQIIRVLEWARVEEHITSGSDDCGIPLSAIVSSASIHDSLAAIPLATIAQQGPLIITVPENHD